MFHYYTLSSKVSIVQYFCIKGVKSAVDGWLDNDLKCTLRRRKETRFYKVYVSSVVSGLVLFILVLT